MIADQISLFASDTIIPAVVDEAEPATDPSYKDKGIIFAALLDSLEDLLSSRENFCSFLRQAILNKLWLGFVHPRSGKLISFMHRGNDGEVDDSVSFKLWVSASPKKGGLGINSMDELEQLTRLDRATAEMVIPLILDQGSIRRANDLRAIENEPPLLKLNDSKAYLLKKTSEAPAEFAFLRYAMKMSLDFVGRCSVSFLKLNPPEQAESLATLGNLIESHRDNRRLLEEKVSELFGVPVMRMVSLNLSDPYLAAKSISRNLDKTAIREIAESLLAIANSPD